MLQLGFSKAISVCNGRQNLRVTPHNLRDGRTRLATIPTSPAPVKGGGSLAGISAVASAVGVSGKRAQWQKNCCGTLGMLFGTIWPKIWISTRASFLDKPNRSKSKANSRQGDTGCLRIPHTGTFLPKSSGYLPAISTIPGKEENHGGPGLPQRESSLSGGHEQKITV